MKRLLLFILLFSFFYSFSQDILMQDGTVNNCGGTFYDTGGSANSYSNDEDFTITICPDGPDQTIQLVFNSFSTALLDNLTIYDGDDTTGTVIGTYFGSTSPPGTVTATNPSGCITINFVSNATNTGPGWEAEINCLQACQTITPAIDSTNPMANGAGVVEVGAGVSVDFNGSATFSEDDTGATYNWDFGDGTNGVGASVSHTFTNAGTYTVTFSVTDANPTGCTQTTTIDVVVLSPYIQVDQTTYTTEQLITDVLIDSPCAAVSNIVGVTGTNYGSSNGIGYFSGSNGAFPFDSGLILCSGDANAAEGPESGTQSNGNNAWVGDADLENAIPGLNISGTTNASYIEFDFVPIASSISFEFIFASEEYGTFQCTFTDAFAFLLTDQTTGITTNLAIVPGTTDVVSVLNVRDNAYNAGCASANVTFFDEYYGFGGADPDSSPTNYLGRTVPMTAFSNVTPNNPYSIKLVVADDANNGSDTAYDAAVFLGAGTFSLGGDLGDDITIAAGNAVCQGNPIVLDTNVPGATHTWYQDGVEIPGETGPVINVNDAGVYSVDIVFSATCQASPDPITIEFIPGPTANPALNLTSCDSGAGAIFDLTENDDDVLGTQSSTDFTIIYYESQMDLDNDNPIADPENYAGTNGGLPIFAQIEDALTQSCSSSTTFTLTSFSNIINPVTNITECDTLPNDTMAEFNLEAQTPIILGTQSNTDYIVTYHNTLADATADTGALSSPHIGADGDQIFIRIEATSDSTCFTVSQLPEESFFLEVTPRENSTFTMTSSCVGGTVDAGSVVTPGGSFDFSTPVTDGALIDMATGEVTMGTPSATYLVEYTTNGACPTTTAFSLTLLPSEDSSFSYTPNCEGGLVTTEATPGGTYIWTAPAPTDGALLDSATGAITSGIPGATYSV
ncbi:choice-of-anchor L domain-containing protein, partial [Lacinutrix salivirga]